VAPWPLLLPCWLAAAVRPRLFNTAVPKLWVYTHQWVPAWPEVGTGIFLAMAAYMIQTLLKEQFFFMKKNQMQ
jgi:hypothetical protein